MIIPDLILEEKCWRGGCRIVAGIDEAGRGPLAGPVVAGAVVVLPDQAGNLREHPEFNLIRDSKTLSEKQRDRAFQFIASNFAYGIGWSGHETIDRINILQASYLAMKKSVSDLKRKLGSEIDILLVDGRSPIPNLTIAQKSIIGGDSTVFSISAASIIAKVTRDRMMKEFHETYPRYGFDRHKGYGTRRHFEMIVLHGPCEIHRKSFGLTAQNGH